MKLKFWRKSDRKIRISVVINFYNMQREARRTLYSLTTHYQQNAGELPYEVIVLDNGSSQPLGETIVRSFGNQFRYVYFGATTPSPCEALNHGIQLAHGELVMICIDGARILSPGILHFSTLATQAFKNPFIYTLGMHIGHKAQNLLIEDNYSQSDEDALLASTNWEEDGYALFDISSIALSSRTGYLSRVSESNCITMLKATYEKIGGFDERFNSAGGGLANLDFFNRVNNICDIDPIMLLGEATFHQFHGGTATNVAMKDHPWERIAAEYAHIHGSPFESYSKQPFYFGKIHPKSEKFFIPKVG